MFLYLQMIETPEEQERFDRVYHRFGGLMHHAAYEILQNDHDAEDAVHEAFIKIAQNISKIMDLECPRTQGYIVTIVESKAIDIYRLKKKRREIPLGENGIGIYVDYCGMEDLAKCIAKLPVRYRQVLSLKYLHGYDNREIADLLDITQANAIKIDQRAKNRLYELCVKEGIL